MKLRKLLLIKTGWSETLDPEISQIASLGDIFRTTVVLHEFQNFEVTWLVDRKGALLLENNPHVHRTIFWESASSLKNEIFDLLINFEKGPELCELAQEIRAEKKLGFSLSPATGMTTYERSSEYAFSLCQDTELKRRHQEPWQKVILGMAGKVWNKQEYLLTYQPQGEPRFDFGLNHEVGAKWPTKMWPKTSWERLAKLLEERGYTVSWQRGMSDINEYTDWLHSCRNVITCDSLGLHLALALKKNTTVLYGPTNPAETYLYGRGAIVQAPGFSCTPCLQKACRNDRFCMESISPEAVLEVAVALLMEQSPEVFVLNGERKGNRVAPAPSCRV